MLKYLSLLICFGIITNVNANDFESERAKYQKMKNAAMEKHSKENQELKSLNLKTKDLSQKMMQMAINLSPKIAEAESAKRWSLLIVEMEQLAKKHTEFNALFQERKKSYEEISNILHNLEPQLKEQAKKTWQAKKALEDV